VIKAREKYQSKLNQDPELAKEQKAARKEAMEKYN
jgi:hypothetical protein